MRLLFAGGGTGGHLYPGLAIARALVRLDNGVEPFFVGAMRGIERQVLPGTEFEHELMELHPLYRSKPWRNWQTLVGGVRSWGRMRALLKSLQPKVVVGTGGYAAALALAAGRLAGIPLALQEQNSYPGLTMRLFSRAAREVYLGFPEAARYLARGSRTSFIDTGNPIDPPPGQRPSRSTALAQWGFPSTAQRVILVVGGSQGAKPLNAAMAGALRALTATGAHVIWATGTGNFEEYRNLNSERARVVPYLSPIALAYAACDFAVCRAGAITTAELCAWGIPSLLIPLPTAAADHQTANARALEAAGCSAVMPQSQLSSTTLVSAITRLLDDEATLNAMAATALARGRPMAAEVIAKRLLTLSHIT